MRVRRVVSERAPGGRNSSPGAEATKTNPVFQVLTCFSKMDKNSPLAVSYVREANPHPPWHKSPPASWQNPSLQEQSSSAADSDFQQGW